MDSLHAVVLALIQGITEFLPISSSGHLILLPHLMGWQDQGLMFDIAANTGSLVAVMLYFRHEMAQMGQGSMQLLRQPMAWQQQEESRLVVWLGLATIPVGIVGLLSKDWIATVARDPMIIATTSIVFGLLLWWADRSAKQQREWQSMGWRQVLWIGAAQAVALIPGTSRSGITMTAGLMLGLTRESAARFSFLMAIPVGVLAALLDIKDLFTEPLGDGQWQALLIGFAVSLICAYAVIHWLLGWLRRQSMLPFVIYRLALGGAIFLLLG
uniref:Undecaprenyl-diphosphatase n=1 Tax=Magnetococcus massalia (strain MO-1) TaxID=451514 RepID=A0A1S7LH68_MAGMO|nr:Undecaprenyl-diphosphatase [Candidatus Magnetococcus massalia]